MPEHLSIPSVVGHSAKAEALMVKVALPGIIRSYSATQQSCSVQPAIRQPDGTEYPVIPLLPVQFDRGGGFAVTYPLSAGDPCSIVFYDRDVENWFIYGQEQPPHTNRRWAFNDAVVIPGASPYPNPSPVASPTDMVIGLENSNMLIRISPTGQISIGNENTAVDLLKLIDDIWSQLQITTVRTSLGPQPFGIATITALGQARASLQSIKGS